MKVSTACVGRRGGAEWKGWGRSESGCGDQVRVTGDEVRMRGTKVRVRMLRYVHKGDMG